MNQEDEVIIKDLLTFIFEEGLDEDAYYRFNPINSDKLLKYKESLDNSLEKDFLELLLSDIEDKRLTREV